MKLLNNGEEYVLKLLETWLTMVLVMLVIDFVKLWGQGFNSSAKLFNRKSNVFKRAARLCIVAVKECYANIWRQFVACREVINNQGAE